MKDKPSSIYVRLEQDLKDAVAAQAKREHRSVSATMVAAAEFYLDANSAPRGAATPAKPKRQAPKPTLSQGIAGAQAGADEAKREAMSKALTDKPAPKRKAPRAR